MTARGTLGSGQAAWAEFDAAWYAARHGIAETSREALLRHYLETGQRDGHSPNPFFDEAWYRAQHPDVAAAIAAGAVESGFDHYCREHPTRRDPEPAFSESFYLARYPDVAEAVRQGWFRNGYAHFLAAGARELRSPRPEIDLAWYASTHPEVRADLEAGRAADAFAHYLRIGRARGLAVAPPADEPVGEGAGKSLFRARARALLPLWGRAPLDFAHAGAPAVSVVMALHDQFALTMMALAALRAGFPDAIELILVDSGSADETRHIGRYVRGAQIIRLEENVGFVRACNAGLYGVAAPAVLFLNTDAEPAPGALAAALARLGSDPSIGAVGGKIVRSHGRLQEAGSIVWRTGETAGYMRDASPLAPEANFVRDTDYCSAVFLLVRAALLERLGGFDDAYAPAYYEDADLCARIAQAGHRVVYDPAVVVHHLEYGSAPTRAASEARIAQNRAVFVARHGAWLARRAHPGQHLRARSPARTRRVLFLEDTLPRPMLGSGFVRSNDILHAMAELGWHVTAFPVNGCDADVAAVYADLPDTVEAMHDRALADLGALLAERAGYYDAIWIARTHNLRRVAPVLEAAEHALPPIVLDTEALASLREERRAALDGAPFDRGAALGAELAGAELCQSLVAVTEAEAATLRTLGFPRVHVLGHARAPAPTAAPWEAREGMLFVGAIHEAESPNLDGLCWFADAVLPRVEAALGWRTRLTVAGHCAPGVSLERLARHSRITLLGAVPDTRPLYERARVFVAPTRFAAGLPYKVHEAAALGLPVVATELLADQLDWRSATELLAAPPTDPDAFAAHILALESDPALWRRLRDAALARVAGDCARAPFAAAIARIVG